MKLKKIFRSQAKKIEVLWFVFLGLMLFVPVVALAQGQVDTGLRSSGLMSLFGVGGISGSQSMTQLILNIIRMLLTFAAGIAVLFIIIGGYQYITSHGNEERAEAGKRTLVNAVIGVVLIVLAYAIITVVVNTVSGPTGLF